MEINNTVYDVSKWIVLIFLPALAVLMSGLGELYGWINATTIVGTINLLTVFLGSILQVSSNKYKKRTNIDRSDRDNSECSKSG